MKPCTIETAAIVIALALPLSGCVTEPAEPGTSSANATEVSASITWFPETEEDWNVVGVVKDFQGEAPAWAIDAIEQASWEDLGRGVSVSYQQEVAQYPGGSEQNMAVELTVQAIDMPYDDFVRLIPTETWGVNLDHYLGGEVLVYETDEAGRATRQLERMVLSPFPCDFSHELSNNDMTKVEVIEHGSNYATVYWRVMHSNNNSTEVDVGSVDFWGIDESTTLVTFHSAHRLNALGIHIPAFILEPALRKSFLDFTNHYAELALGG